MVSHPFRWLLVLAALASGVGTIWIAPADNALSRILLGSAIALFALGGLSAPSRRLRTALAVDACIIGVFVAGAFDATPISVIATVALFVAPALALRQRTPPQEAPTDA